MKFYRLAALTTAGVLCFGLLAGCGTSHMSESELESVDSSWQQLSTPTSTPTPKAETVMPELEQKDKQDGGTDVTKDYKNSFVGTWDDADGFDIYEFKSNENLVITTGKEIANYTYWLEDNGKQVLLYIFENGQEEAETYSFTLSGSNLTLYDTVSGNAVKQLVQLAHNYTVYKAHCGACHSGAGSYGYAYPSAFTQSQHGALSQPFSYALNGAQSVSLSHS